MAFTLPNFNLNANILRIVGGGYTIVGNTPANLAMGRRSALDRFPMGATTEVEGLVPTLLVPAGTDVRDHSCAPDNDVVEVPAGSGRWYGVGCVDDIGKGFANEHRAVSLKKVGWFAPWNALGLTAWPAPIP